MMNSMRRSVQQSGSPEAEAMMELSFQVLEPTFSRNRNFDFYRTPEGKILLNFRKIVQGLLADLGRTDANEPIHYTLNSSADQVWLELQITRYRANRRSCVSVREFEALKAHPLLSERLTPRAQA